MSTRHVNPTSRSRLYRNLGSIFSIDGTITETGLKAAIQLEADLTKAKITVPLSTIACS